VEHATVYTHGHHESVLRSHRWRTVENSAAYLVAHLETDTRLLDVGCGPGTITVDFAGRLADGLVVGVDRAGEIVSQAAELAAETADRRRGPVAFLPADVYTLPFGDAAFDVVHAHQVLQHLDEPVAALVEMRRVCRPGGLVAARDSDYAAMTWYPAVPELDRWLELYRRAARANGAEPDAGRHLLHWAQEAGFSEVTTSASAWCFATPAERSWWGRLWADRVVGSALADQLLARELATSAELGEISRAWRAWASRPDAWFAVLHGEVLGRA
jgi:ubiquinone/menaquinone biosynthesis C-methylase UbiE